MKYLLITIILVIGVIVLLYQRNETTPQPDNLYALGDSLTFGTGSGGGDYPGKLSELLGKDVINKGVAGNTTAMMFDRFDFNGTVIVWGGINDIYRGYPTEVIKDNLQRIYNRVGGKLIVITITPSQGDKDWDLEKQQKTEEINEWILNSNADIKIDAYKLLSDGYKLDYKYDSGDHLHLNQDGYYLITNELFNKLK